jgi:hypothetical protein
LFTKASPQYAKQSTYQGDTMKRLVPFLALSFLVALFALSFTACSKDEKTPIAPIANTPTPTFTPNLAQIPTVCTQFGNAITTTNTFLAESSFQCWLVSQKWTLAAPATIYALSGYIGDPDTDSTLQLGIYSDSAGEPLSLLASTAVFTPANGYNLQTITPISLAAGNYWLSLHFFVGTQAGATSTTDGLGTIGYLPNADTSFSRRFAWAGYPGNLSTLANHPTGASGTWQLNLRGYSCP